MQEEKKPSRGKVMGLLAVSLVIQSLSSVFIKYAGTYETMSKEFIIFYVLILFGEKVTIPNIIGSIIIIAGISLHGMDEH